MKIISILLCTLVFVLFTATGCNNSKKDDNKADIHNGESNYSEKAISGTEITTLSESTDVPTTVYDISNDYEVVLASGSDNEGNYYMLVGNETEDFEGVKVKVGVIKNDEWLMKPTSDMPFIKDSGEFLNGGGLEKATSDILFVGNECFRYRCKSKEILEVYYNVNTKKYYKNNGGYYSILEWKECLYDGAKYERQCVVDHEEKIFIPVAYYEKCVKYNILDTKTMTINGENSADIYFDRHGTIYPISEDMFAVATHNDKVTFYNSDGSLAIDLSEYKTNGDQRFIFEEGLCTFRIKNNNGTEYDITINKNGDVVDSVEVIE